MMAPRNPEDDPPGSAYQFLLVLQPRHDQPRHPITGRFLAFDCEIDCLEHCAGLCGNMAIPDLTSEEADAFLEAVAPLTESDDE